MQGNQSTSGSNAVDAPYTSSEHGHFGQPPATVNGAAVNATAHTEQTHHVSM